MSVQTVYVRYHLPAGSRIARVVVRQDQLTQMHKNGDSFLWPILNQRVRENLGLEEELPLLFGNIILTQLREGMFIGEVVEIDLTDVHEAPETPASPWRRWRILATTLFRPKRVPSNTNGA